MSFKTVLLHLNSVQHCEPIISAGVSIAERHGAHLIGVYVLPPLVVYMGVPVPGVVSSFHDDYQKKLSDSVGLIFKEQTLGRTFTAEWRLVQAEESPPVTAIAKLAHTCDLLIIGNNPLDNTDVLPGNQLQSVVTSTCRPTLVVPVDYPVPELGNNILIAWDGTDESTRAVFDSLPLLKLSKEVTVHRINPSSSERHHTIGTSSELVATLSRHGINVELSFSVEAHNEIGKELARVATEKGADTIVMGAFGHSRLHGMLLGSVSNTMLNDMKMPILMSH